MKKVLNFKYLAETIIAAVFIAFTCIANLTLLEGSNLNKELSAHDEYVAVNEVYNILHPHSAKHFFMAVTTGSIQYYGRAVFYMDAAIAFIPEKIWGLNGMVFSIRMFHALLMALAAWILALAVFKTPSARISSFMILLFSYYTVYFGIIPKPEPHQFFFFSLFIFWLLKNDFKTDLGFLFLGLAFGIKFNMLMLLPVFFLLAFLKYEKSWRAMLRVAGFFLAGLILANPYLLLGIVKKEFLYAYLNNTILFVQNIDDVATVSFKDWLASIWFVHFNPGSVMGILVFLTAIVMAANILVKQKVNALYSPAFLFLVSAMLMLFPVMLWSKRLYPHYLWPGYVLLVIGAIAVAEELNINKWFKTSIIIIFGISGLSYSFRKLPLLMNERVKAETESKNQQYCISRVLEGMKYNCVAQDIGVYYSFESLVQNHRYHPFSSPVPFESVKNKILWFSGFTKSDINSANPEIIILSNSFKQTKYYTDKNSFYQSDEFSLNYVKVDQPFSDKIIFYTRKK